jgi:hypothetical protein
MWSRPILAGSLIPLQLFPAMLAMLISRRIAAGSPILLRVNSSKVVHTASSISWYWLTGNVTNYLMGLMSKAVGIHSFPGYLMACLVFMVFLFSIVIKKISTRIKV